MVGVKRVYEKAATDDGCRVLVDRLWPRGMKKESAHIHAWMKEVAPSDALRKWFAHDPQKWPEFQKRYRSELKKCKPQIAELCRLEKEYGKLTLLFGAKDEKHNQAVVLAEVVKGRKG